ncbi:hypothetical protein HYQ46_009109 [Verticillium longisporum]|nr:hypothetical protein HYQ46_009109 [Verticillium longisporum]
MDSLAEPFRPGQALTEQMYSSAKEQSQLPIPPFNPKLGDSRENGHTRGAKSESHSADGAWQKATKGRKKGGDGRVAAPSEQPPRSGEDRKGG